MRYYLFLSLVIIVTACNDGLQLQTDFDFEVTCLPYHTTLSQNEQVELRLEIKSIGGNYENTQYFMRYFQYTGKGTLTSESGQVFVPNDAYDMQKQPFRFYFTPQLGEQHQVELTFYDSFNHEHILMFNFTIEEEETN